MQIPITLLRPRFCPEVGMTVEPRVDIIPTWYQIKYKWTAALVHHVTKSRIDEALECRLVGVANGVWFDFTEFSDYLQEKK